MKIYLKTKLMLAFVILIVVPLVILGGFSYKMSSNALQNSIQQQLKNETIQTSAQIQQAIDSVKHSVQIASLNDSVRRTSQNSSDIDKDIAFQYIKEIQQNNKDSIEELIITDEKGKVVVDSDSKTPDLNLSDREYFKKAISGSEAISDILVSRFTGNPSIFVAYPLKIGDKIMGTLVGSIRFDYISSYAAKIKIGNSGYAYMVDKTGMIVYNPDKSKILKENLSDTTSKDLKFYVDEMKAGKTSEGFYTYEGVYKYVSFTPTAGWTIAVTANYNEYMAPAKAIRNNTIIIIILSIIIAIISAYVFSKKSIIDPIKGLEKVMKLAGQGDLTVSINVKSKDEMQELGDSFNSMIKHQNEIVSNIELTAQQLNAASEEIAASSEELSATTEHISESVNQVAQETENQNKSIVNASEILVQLSSLVQIAQHKAKATSSNANNTAKAAELGRNKVDETVKAMNIISLGTDETANALQVVNNLSVKVGGIISTINAISKQTNLLALNAAIEAARAGENGKGFSVVADEVRKLSEETNNNSIEIASLVNEMINQSKNAVISMDRAKTEVCNGVIIVEETDKAFVNIIGTVVDIVANIEEILDITNDEVASSDQIVKLINEMATMTENTSAHSENVSSATTEQVAGLENLAATAQETSAMAEELNNLVEKFII